MDSGCSRHMTGDASKFTTLILKDQGNVTYGDNQKTNVIGESNILVNKDLSIKNILLVEELKHNFTSISQLCDNGFKVTFCANECSIEKIDNNQIKFEDIEMFIKLIWIISSPQMKYVYILQMMIVGCDIAN